jgi:hypothetical protein
MPTATKVKRKARPQTGPKGPVYIIISKTTRGRHAGRLLLDPLKLTVPETTTKVDQAKTFHGRNSAHKYLARHPEVAKRYRYQRLQP